MKKSLSIIISLFLFISVYGQDIEAIRQSVTADKESYLLKLEQFKNGDESLTEDDLVYLYYGFAFMPQYDGNTNMLFDLESAIMADDKEKSLEEALKHEDVNPVCLEILWQLGKLTDNTSQGKVYFKRLVQMIHVVMQSGDGKTEQTAFKVIRTGDEYVILSLFELTDSIEQITSTEEGIDRFDFVKKGDSRLTLYFDRTLPTAKDAEIWRSMLNENP